MDEKSYLVVEAVSEEIARWWARLHLENDYAFIYPFDEDFAEQIEQYGLHEVPNPYQ